MFNKYNVVLIPLLAICLTACGPSTEKYTPLTIPNYLLEVKPQPEPPIIKQSALTEEEKKVQVQLLGQYIIALWNHDTEQQAKLEALAKLLAEQEKEK